MSTIQETVRRAVPSRYSSQAQPAVDALVQREQGIATQLMEFASSKGANASEVRELLTGLGVAIPATQGNDSGLGQRISNLERRLANAERFAQRHGYRA